MSFRKTSKEDVGDKPISSFSIYTGCPTSERQPGDKVFGVTRKVSSNSKHTLLLSRESNNPPANELEFTLLFRLTKHRFPMPKLPKRRTGIRLMCKSELYFSTQGTKAEFSLLRNADNSVNSMPICANYSQKTHHRPTE